MPSLYKKIVRYILAFIAIITLNFFVPRLMPGDPVINLLGEDLSMGENQLEQLREELGLDRPLGRQYLSYWKDILTLDLGYSYHYNRLVSEVIGNRVRWTLLLVGPSIVLGAIGGAVLGAYSGWNTGRLRSKIGSSLVLVIYSVPPFFLALLFLYLFAFKFGLFPLKGYYETGTFFDIAWHLVLPVIVLSLFTLARNFTIMRGSVLQERRRLYVVYAKAKGIADRSILKRHVFGNASLPLITLVALDFGFIFSGALFVEIIFSMNGMGTLLYDAINALDYPILQGAFLVIGVMIICANICADVLYSLVDPRVRIHR
jgi:peptide/nickel transport system permease protein